MTQFFFSSRRRHTRLTCDWSSDVCSSDLEEMLELAHQGAQVMQTRAVELGWVNGVVIEVLSSFEDAPGTLIKEDPFVEQRNKVRGLAHDRNVAKVTVVEVPDRPGVARAVFEPLAEAGINVD